MIKAVAVLAIALAAQEQAPTPIRWSAQPRAYEATAGGVITVQATAEIDEGWHLYALDAVEAGPIPTRFSAGPADAFTLENHDIEKEEPKRALDPNFSVETGYYEGSAAFGLPIVVAGDVKGERRLEVTVRFQACTTRICLRPQTATMKLDVKILD
jgi:Thiol:disulfide interchange protein DsbD, N-terminal